MNKWFISIFLTLGLLLKASIALADLETVTASEANVATCASTITSLTPCVTTPRYYRIYVYEMGLCNNVLGANPNTANSASPMYWRNNCVKTYDAGATPQTVIIENNVSSALPEAYEIEPVNGTYTHGYVLLRNQIDVKGYQTFHKSLDVAGWGGSGGDDNGTTNTVCWTAGNSTTNCGTEVNNATYDYNSTTIGNLGDGGNCTGVTNFHCTYYSLGDAGDGLDPTHAFMLDSSLALETSNGSDVAYLLGIASFRSLKTKNNDTTQYEVQFKVTRGMTVNGNGSSPTNIGLWLTEFKTITNLR
jgi:hypothetical protein